MVENRPPTSVSDAQESADKDYAQRVRRYTISMIIRVVCLLLAFVFTGPLRWVMLAGAVILPYVAVVIANSRNERLVHYQMSGVDGPTRPVLPPESDEGREGGAPDDAADEPFIVGEVLADSVDGESNTDDEEDEDGR
ncbi:MAG TPA: DUF3099 domain-containing protein [Brevibacterium sp.]|nr:DUF3099 domain-containing protein [Brevibacterium sp.]